MSNRKEPLLHKVFFSKYFTTKKLGEGSFGMIYQATYKNEQFALKFENKIDSQNLLQGEAYIMSYLKGPGIPFVKSFGYSGDYNILVMELLGKSLEDIFESLKIKRMSLKTVCMLGIQMITILNYVHDKHIIHRDIKPDNFVTGLNEKKKYIYLLDFGLAKKYRSSKTLEHYPMSKKKKLTGTARYASINALKGYDQSRRDDLEAVGYVLIYFLLGVLPWQGLICKNNENRYEKIMLKKESTTPEELCRKLPEEFRLYVEYTRGLQYTEDPDYEYLKRLLRQVIDKEGEIFDYIYDWLVGEKLDDDNDNDKDNDNDNDNDDDNKEDEHDEDDDKENKDDNQKNDDDNLKIVTKGSPQNEVMKKKSQNFSRKVVKDESDDDEDSKNKRSKDEYINDNDNDNINDKNNIVNNYVLKKENSPDTHKDNDKSSSDSSSNENDEQNKDKTKRSSKNVNKNNSKFIKGKDGANSEESEENSDEDDKNEKDNKNDKNGKEKNKKKKKLKKKLEISPKIDDSKINDKKVDLKLIASPRESTPNDITDVNRFTNRKKTFNENEDNDKVNSDNADQNKIRKIEPMNMIDESKSENNNSGEENNDDAVNNNHNSTSKHKKSKSKVDNKCCNIY